MVSLRTALIVNCAAFLVFLNDWNQTISTTKTKAFPARAQILPISNTVMLQLRGPVLSLSHNKVTHGYATSQLHERMYAVEKRSK